MLIKRRGKSGLLCLNKGWEESRKWIEERAGKLQKVGYPFAEETRINTLFRLSMSKDT
jgi:succinyl-CoA synthetase beta subunit